MKKERKRALLGLERRPKSEKTSPDETLPLRSRWHIDRTREREREREREKCTTYYHLQNRLRIYRSDQKRVITYTYIQELLLV